MLHKLRIAIAAALIAAAAVPVFTAPSQAQSAASQSYWDRHGTKGW